MTILLIVPCYNEADRINLASFEEGRTFLKQKGFDIKFLFANDGSNDKTEEILRLFIMKTGDFLYCAPQNAGKANVIQQAYQYQVTNETFNYEWIGYWDADLATPLNEVHHMMSFYKLYEDNNISSIWGSRVSRLGSDIRRKMHRHYLGRIFVTVVSNVLGVKAYDSQCGAKLFKPHAAAIAFQNPFISRWIFDVEILLRLKDIKIIEFPLFQWADIPGSKVKVFREMFRVMKDLMKIKKTYKV